MQAINAKLSHTRLKKTGARYFRYDSVAGETVEVNRPSTIVGHSMFPYKSTAMACEPWQIPHVKGLLKREAEGPAKFTEFDEQGRPIITSAAQQDDLAKALGMKTGRDGYGHMDENGKFQNSGRRRTDEMNAGRARVRRVIKELEQMPDDVPAGAVNSVMNEYDIRPTEENTG
jgi:hypothetical protein